VSSPAFDQRKEPRLALTGNTSATLSILNGAEVGIPHAVEVVNLSGRGLRLRAAQAQTPGTLVRIDLNQTLMLAEVCYSEPDGQSFALGLRLEHSLLQTEGLARLRQRFTDEEVEIEVASVDRSS
jgi:PilZ domain